MKKGEMLEEVEAIFATYEDLLVKVCKVPGGQLEKYVRPKVAYTYPQIRKIYKWLTVTFLVNLKQVRYNYETFQPHQWKTLIDLSSDIQEYQDLKFVIRILKQEWEKRPK